MHSKNLCEKEEADSWILIIIVILIQKMEQKNVLM